MALLSGQICVGEVGKNFDVTLTQSDGTGFDLSVASSNGINYRFQDPSNVATVVPGTIVTSSAGIVRYTTTAGIMSQKGDWKLQVWVDTSTGASYCTEVLKFTVGAALST